MMGSILILLLATQLSPEEAHRRGDAAYQAGDFETALENFRAGYAADPHTSFMFNIAQCLRQLGRYQASIEWFERYRDGIEDPAAKKRAEGLIAQVDKEMRAAKPSVPPPPPPAEPPPPPPEIMTSPPPTPPPPEEVAAVPPPEVVTSTPPEASSSSIAEEWWFWTLIGVAAAGAATGIYVGLQGGSDPDVLDPRVYGQVDFTPVEGR